MKKLNILIIDDEPFSRIAIRHILEDNTDYILFESSSVEETLRIIELIKPDIVISDVELSDGTVFDILKVCTNFTFQIIFCTAFDHYAVKAFRYAAVDYLLKPIQDIELKEALVRAEKYQSVLYPGQLDILLEEREQPSKLAFHTTKGVHLFLPEEIIHLKADDNYTYLHTTREVLLLSKTLKFFETSLIPLGFLRTHQSHIVNLTHVIGYLRDGNLQMSNGDLIPVSVRRKASVLEKLK